MQDLIDRFNSETVPRLCAKWPEKFTHVLTGTMAGLWLKLSDGWPSKVNSESLDSLAAIAEACGVVTEAYFAGTEPPYRWFNAYTYTAFGMAQVRLSEGWFPTELSARLAATIAAIAAIAGGEE